MSSEETMVSKLSPTTYRTLTTQLATALQTFQSSDAKFRVLKTITTTDLLPHDPIKLPPSESPKTLFILDSSFNPPSIAHQTLALSALANTSSTAHPKPHRLLLLFATMNAEKAPSAASFDQRLTLMTLFATDLLSHLKEIPATHSVPTGIDIGVTNQPYYTDKSHAIDTEATHENYPSQPAHVHMVGYDTLTRFLAPKYYPNFHPPLAALEPFFSAGHGLRVTLRPDADFGSEEEQRAFVRRVESGEMEREGAKREWAGQIEVVPANERTGVSSTRIRRAAKSGEWEVVGELCTERVAAYVRSEGLYEGDDRGAKMA
ncbi:hypothetical protein LTR62_007288 [Meristemomyces frigidus]|uniref:Nicotinamide-nucleotide adenylyltransferase n=1 Tax=Meristemomyces frigidus TaxID=1508187 RepID=A0AAN7YT47_9PEZI|nr:hypothetical protein LTR62_007288 [Meristemomyces frigidus]